MIEYPRIAGPASPVPASATAQQTVSAVGGEVAAAVPELPIPFGPFVPPAVHGVAATLATPTAATRGTGAVRIPRDLAARLHPGVVETLRGILAEPTDPHHNQLVGLLGASAFERLPADTRINFLRMIAGQAQRRQQGESPRQIALLSLARHPGFRGLDPEGQRRVIEIAQHLTSGQQATLRRLLDRNAWEWGFPPRRVALLSTKDHDGNTLLTNLFTLATGRLDPAVAQTGIGRGDILGGLLEEIDRPGQIDQHSKGTCTVTTMQYMLALEDPAELSRLVTGLVSPGGAVRMRGGGMLERVPDSLESDGTHRTVSERLFQAALMDYANGEGLYSNGSDTTIRDGWFRWDEYGGLRSDESKRALEALFGSDFDQVYNWSFPAWYGAPLPDLVETLAQEAPAWVALRWGSGGHAVLITAVRDGRVYFRNPWGPQGRANGSTATKPTRRMEDNTIGLESMTVADFREHAKYGFIRG